MHLKTAFIIILIATGLVTATGLTLVIIEVEEGTVESKDSEEKGWSSQKSMGFTIMLMGLIFGSPLVICAGGALASTGVVNKKTEMIE